MKRDILKNRIITIANYLNEIVVEEGMIDTLEQIPL